MILANPIVWAGYPEKRSLTKWITTQLTIKPLRSLKGFSNGRTCIIWWECVYNYYCTQSRVYFGFILFFIYVEESILTHMILFNTQTTLN